MTRAIVEACQQLGIAIHDPINIGKDGLARFKNLGLL
jgi:hypothetical protein